MVAAFPNPGNILRPGQFGRVRALLGVRQGAVLVPQRCVTELQGTYEVAVVTAQNSISIRKVKVGDRVGSLWVINEGLAPGEEVVSDGTSKVRDGMSVTPKVETPQAGRKPMISQFFIDRPIVAMVISIVMVIVGAVAMATLPISQFPEIIPPEIQVRAVYPGADARTMMESVATPIESLMSGVDYMNYMYSTNDNAGNSVLTVNFDVTTNPNIDQILTQLRVSQATPQLPAMVNTTGVIVQKSRAAAMMVISFYSPHATYDRNFLTNYAYINYVDELSRIPGVGRVQVFGGPYAMRIWVRPDQLAKLGVTVPQIVAAVEAQNTVNPSGQIGGEPVPKGQEFTYTVRSQGRLVTPEEFGDIVVRANPDGSTLRLKDVARLELGAQTLQLRRALPGRARRGPRHLPVARFQCARRRGGNSRQAGGIGTAAAERRGVRNRCGHHESGQRGDS